MKTRYTALLLLPLLLFSGCGLFGNSDYGIVYPPAAEHPTAAAYEFCTVSGGNLNKTISFSGNFSLDPATGDFLLYYRGDFANGKGFEVGQTGSIEYKSSAGKTCLATGTLTAIPGGGNYYYKVRVDSYQEGTISVQLPATFEVVTATMEDVVYVPASCLTVYSADGAALAYRLNSAGVLEEIPVQTGETVNGKTIILSGLSAGEEIVKR